MPRLFAIRLQTMENEAMLYFAACHRLSCQFSFFFLTETFIFKVKQTHFILLVNVLLMVRDSANMTIVIKYEAMRVRAFDIYISHWLTINSTPGSYSF